MKFIDAEKDESMMCTCEATLRSHYVEPIRKKAETFGDFSISESMIPVVEGSSRSCIAPITLNQQPSSPMELDDDSGSDNHEDSDNKPQTLTRKGSRNKKKKEEAQTNPNPFNTPGKFVLPTADSVKLDSLANMIRQQSQQFTSMEGRLTAMEKSIKEVPQQSGSNGSTPMTIEIEGALRSLIGKRKLDNDHDIIQQEQVDRQRGLSSREKLICLQTIIGLLFE